jgi:hypothetical protein
MPHTEYLLPLTEEQERENTAVGAPLTCNQTKENQIRGTLSNIFTCFTTLFSVSLFIPKIPSKSEKRCDMLRVNGS